MPEWCISTRCIDCESHAIVKGKIDCNYMNRLGLSQPTVKSFLEGQMTPEKAEEETKNLERQIEEMQKRREELAKLAGKAGEEESG